MEFSASLSRPEERAAFMKLVTASVLIAIGTAGATAHQARRARAAAAEAVAAAQAWEAAQAKSEKITADAQVESKKQRAAQIRWLFCVSALFGCIVLATAVWATLNTTGLADRFFGADETYAQYVPYVLWAQVAGIAACCVIIWCRRATADATRWNNMLITMWTLAWSLVVVFGIAAGASGNPPEWLGSVLVTLLSINLPLSLLLILTAPKESPAPTGQSGECSRRRRTTR